MASIFIDNMILIMIIVTLVNFILFLFKDANKGVSIGKKIMKIAVRDSRNYEKIPSILILVLRNIFILLWPIEMIIFLSSNDSKRFGDKVFDTDVVCFEKEIS